MKYQWKIVPEVIFAAVVAAVIAAATVITQTDAITEWESWVYIAAGGAARAAAAAVIAVLTRSALAVVALSR